MPQSRETVDLVVMIADLIDSTQYALALDLDDYDRLLYDFQTCACKTIESISKRYDLNATRRWSYSIKGDECCLALVEQQNVDIRQSLIMATDAAISLKRRWLWSRSNLARIEKKLPPFDIAVGIHEGKGKWGRYPGTLDRETAEGATFSITKRVESAFRHFEFGGVIFSAPAINRLILTPDRWRYFQQGEYHEIEAKGLPGNKVKVFELAAWDLGPLAVEGRQTIPPNRVVGCQGPKTHAWNHGATFGMAVHLLDIIRYLWEVNRFVKEAPGKHDATLMKLKVYLQGSLTSLSDSKVNSCLLSLIKARYFEAIGKLDQADNLYRELSVRSANKEYFRDRIHNSDDLEPISSV